MFLCVVGVILGLVIGAYFYNNPLRHSRWFMVRRFLNWFPLGMTYSFLYMGRYNLNVAKNAFGSLMSNKDFGIIFGVGTAVYALSFLVNGPLVDRIGGKRGILVSALGSAGANLLLGVMTYFVTALHVRMNIVLVFSAIYALNMYFQSYGAVSIIKVKAYWFHVRERGVFGAIFGTLISFGIYFAFDWGQGIADLAAAAPGAGWLHLWARRIFAPRGGAVDATWAVFFVPAAILLFWTVLDVWLIKDTPQEAGFGEFDTCDASSGLMNINFTAWELLKKVFTSPLMLMLAAVNLTSGIYRNGVTQWYFIFAAEVKQPGAEFFLAHWGFLVCVFGIVGGFSGGLISDKIFQSRRGPPAAMLSLLVVVLTLVMAAAISSSPFLIGAAGLLIVMAAVGVTSLMAATAATDFGGRKATATSSGIVDGAAYLGSAIQSFSLGYITTWSWHWWPLFLTPFALAGFLLALKIWYRLPAATQRYIDEVELKEPVQIAA